MSKNIKGLNIKNNSKSQNKPKNQKNFKSQNNLRGILVPVGGILLAIVLIAVINEGVNKRKGSDTTKGANQGNAVISETGDLIIPIDEITTTATFYPVEVDGTTLEVLAVKASDGTIRTAFNTCQICYSSGRGFYKQSGDNFICQNCGNIFGTSDVEVTRGGCNPVPIFSENKTVDETNITISNDFLTESKAIFANWKTNY